MRPTDFSRVWGTRLWIVFIIFIFVFTFRCKIFPSSDDAHSRRCGVDPTTSLWLQTLDFTCLNFNNKTGNPSGCYLVPNFIHYVHFGGNPITYVHMICILAAFKNQRPDRIYFHHDNKTTFTGKYWEILEATPGFKDIVEFNTVELPTEIFGQKLSTGWRQWHGSDITRIKMIMKYGGIFLDNDCYLIRSVDNFRRFEISVNWDDNQFLGNQVIVAHKDARFLRKWLGTYRKYDETQWYYNGGERPTVEVLFKEPELIHRVKIVFGAHIMFAYKVLHERWKEWNNGNQYIVHLLERHQYLFKNLTEKATFPVEFNETNIAYYPITFRDMAYDVYEVAKIKWPKDKID